MKLYIAFIDFSYDGELVIGVFDSKEKAEQACKDPNLYKGDGRFIREYIINKINEHEAYLKF